MSVGLLLRRVRQFALAFLLGSGGALLAATAPAWAACDSFAPASNTAVTCTGANTQGVIADGGANVIVKLQSAGSIIPAVNGGLDPTHTNWAIDVGTGAAITIDQGTTADTSARDQQYAVKLNGGSTLTVNGLVKGNGGVTGPILPTFTVYGGFANSIINVGSTGQVIDTEPVFYSAAIAGGGGNNHYTIDGTVKATGNGGNGIIVGNDDVVTVDATGHIETDGPATTSDITFGLTSANGVTVTTKQGSTLETHGASGAAIDLGSSADVTIGGSVYAYGDNPSNPGGQGGGGVIVGSNSTVWLQSTGSVSTGGKYGYGIQVGAGSDLTVDAPIVIGLGAGIGATLGGDATGHFNSSITVAGGGSGTARGIGGAVGTTIDIAKTASVSLTGTGGLAAIYLAPSTSSADNAMTVDIAGQVTADSGRGIFITADNASGSTDVSAHANITIEAGGSLIARTNKAYAQDDGAGSYPEVIDNLIVAGDVETGVANGVAIDLNDGADTVTFLPTYKLVGSIDGGTDPASLPEIDTLAFDGAANTSGTYNFDANPVAHFEAGHKTGAGTWTLSGTAGAGLTGNFSVDAGRLSVNGAMTSTTFTVNSAGTLAGTGTLGATTIASGGFHAPGNSIGTETIDGNYTNHGTLEIEVSPTDADKVVVNGAVDITGAHLVLTEAPATGWDTSHDYTIIDNDAADTVTGTFDVTDNFAFLDPSVIYDGGTGNDVVLTLTRNALAFTSLDMTPNETATAGGVESLGPGNPVYDGILPLSTTSAPLAFDQLSGEIYASIAGTMLTESRIPRDAALDRVDAAFAAIADAGNTRAQNLWTEMVGDMGVVKGDGNAAATGFGTGGFLAGVDGWLSDTVLLGGEAGVTVSAVSAPDRSSSASVNSVHAGVYGGVNLDPVELSFGAALSGHGTHVTRMPGLTGFGETLDSDSAALTGQLFGEIGYAFRLEHGTVEPFVSLALVHQQSGAFAETGGDAALAGQPAALDAGLVTLGLKGSTDFVLPNGGKGRAKAMLGWQTPLAPTPTSTQALAGGTGFTVAGAPLGSQAVLQTDLAFDLSPTVDFDLGASGALGTGGSRGALTASLSGSF